MRARPEDSPADLLCVGHRSLPCPAAFADLLPGFRRGGRGGSEKLLQVDPRVGQRRRIGVGAAGDQHLGQPDVPGDRVAGADAAGREQAAVRRRGGRGRRRRRRGRGGRGSRRPRRGRRSAASDRTGPTRTTARRETASPCAEHVAGGQRPLLLRAAPALQPHAAVAIDADAGTSSSRRRRRSPGRRWRGGRRRRCRCRARARLPRRARCRARRRCR